MTFNLNDAIRFKPKEAGKAIYREYWREACEIAGLPAREIEVNADGWATMQLHEFMRIYGPHIGPGFESPIGMEIELPGILFRIVEVVT